jgi:hypothetical protein
LLEYAAPEDLLRGVEGRVWMYRVASSELTELRQRHLVSGAIRRSDGVQVRVVAEERPDGSAEQAPPSLEDAYLYRLALEDLSAAGEKALAA